MPGVTSSNSDGCSAMDVLGRTSRVELWESLRSAASLVLVRLHDPVAAVRRARDQLLRKRVLPQAVIEVPAPVNLRGAR